MTPADADDQPQDEPRFATSERLALDSERAVWRQVGDEIVILDVPTATYLTLNSSAVTLWKNLEEGATPAESGRRPGGYLWHHNRQGGQGRPALSRGAPGALPDLARSMNPSSPAARPWALAPNPLGLTELDIASGIVLGTNEPPQWPEVRARPS